MPKTVTLTVLVVALAVGAFAVSSRPAGAETCPIGDAQAEKAGGYANAVEAALNEAPNCAQAFTTLSACQLGSSADNALSDIVRAKCEPLFMNAVGPAAKQAYRRALKRCDRVAERNEGTLYQGLAAVCQAKTARDYARKYGRK